MDIINQQEAIRQGLNRYFTGLPCFYGHIALRRVSNQQCTACIREHSRDVYAANKGRWPRSEEGRKRDNEGRRARHQKRRAAKNSS